MNTIIKIIKTNSLGIFNVLISDHNIAEIKTMIGT